MKHGLSFSPILLVKVLHSLPLQLISVLFVVVVVVVVVVVTIVLVLPWITLTNLRNSIHTI